MAQYAYERLSFLDNSFLLMEGPNTPMHVAGTASYEAGSLCSPEGGIDIDRIRAYVTSRLHLIPRYRQRLAWIPVENHPVWIDDDHFNIHYHVRHTALPRPGDERQLKRLAARIMAQHLDRSKPLWELWVVEGLAGGDSFAIISKIHHCMVDGMSSVDLLNVLLQPEPVESFEPAPEWLPRPAPTSLGLLRDAAYRYAMLPIELARNIPELIGEARDPRSDVRARMRAVRDTLSGLGRPSLTPLNQPIGPHRRFDWLAMDLGRVKDVKNRLGGTLNDIVLTTVAGAVRRFLSRRRVHPEHLDFRVMAPVSVRSQQEQGSLGNRVSAWMVPMPLEERDPRERLAKIRQTTAALKDTKQAMGAEMLTAVGEWTPSTLLSLGAQLATRRLPFNLVVTNVPGPQVPLYLLGARMLDNYGLVPLMDNLCLGIVLFSYAGKLCWGFTSDWDLIPDLHDFVLDVEASFRELAELAPLEVAAEPTNGKGRRRAAEPVGAPA
ncbi:MAG TPA: wax ester/triacylglycerol synthase family O-acyltransferase [Candidatus Binatia bacterium]|nr:wax ester/triacylglycerol synthase family O-acyltransferase [Candidatus Binatia bacterium]